MDLQAFKFIFLLEYSHRLLGRILGLVVLLPLFFFWHAFFPVLKRRFIVILTVGSLQGFMGWFMVKSGLVNNPYVSHYRLAIHLSLAFLLLFLLIEVITTLYPHQKTIDRRLKKMILSSLLSVSLTIVYGAFVAGLRAGQIYNTFPKMGTEWLPYEWLFYHPLALNFVENPATVQWIHRMLAFVTLGMCLFLGKRLWHFNYRYEAILVLFAVMLQVTLGIMTVLLIVPISLALLHQLGAVILFSYISILYLRQRPA
jgi:cytochrome c oxidase assembly protein subunit 15